MKTELSKIIAGTMNWGSWGKKATILEMIELIATCLDNEITSFDHADIYGGYTTEAAFGKAFSESKFDRKSIQLITKCGIQSVSENRTTTVKHYDYSKKHIVWSVENSLKNLQTDYLDVLLLHRPSPLLQADEVAEVIEKLKQEGKILDFGLSNFSAHQTELIRQKNVVSFNQIQFSVTHFEAMTDGSLDYMQQHNIQPMSWNPLGNVFKETSEKSNRIKNTLEILDKKYQVGFDILLLSWIMQHPSKVKPVIGTTNLERIKQTKNTITLEVQDWFAIWEASIGNRVA